MLKTAPDRFQDIRDAVRSLCAAFPDEYHRDIDTRRAYPEEFVDALTEAGWLAALIPQEYGGSGLGLAEASVIMEEINRSGGNAGACHGQMYNMGTLLRHGSDAQKQLYLPKIASGELAAAVDGRDRADQPAPTRRKIKTTAVKQRRPLRGQRPEGLDLARPALRLDDPAGAHDAARRGEEEDRGHVDLHGRPARGRAERHDRAADRQHGQSRDQRAVLREPRDPGREPDRRGRQGLQVHPRRPQRRAHADRRRVHRRRLLVHRQASPSTRASASSSAGRSARTRACSSRSPRPTSRSRPPT